MKLFGSYTSPFVRRVRIVALEGNIPFEIVDSSKEAGQAALREVSPIAKVPTAIIDGGVIFDSRAIVERLMEAGSPVEALPVGGRARSDQLNLLNAIDEATLSGVRRFYGRRDGYGDEHPWTAIEIARLGEVLAWLEARAEQFHAFGVPTVSLIATMGWFQFRSIYAVEAYPGLLAAVERHANRPSVLATVPRVS